ncbi:DUF1499 domain-containing protein [Moorena producens JHB]|uniref:DUF1499 domain-containing protein n=1 Tax=Moorena producens (strain JHB) TaxID=1454205 RepID=A0A1D9FUW9_MOOP1|nr:DUF1499 domain-containing protein [Moorena producens]AOY79182.1 DUF1499 domain-containing protein [Moorena producens JHB]
MTVQSQKLSPLRLILIVSISLVLVAIVSIGATFALSGESFMKFPGKQPTNIGIQSSGQLAPCPNTPNCVSSYSKDAEHGIEPLGYNSTPTEAMAKLKIVIQNLERTQIIEEKDNYLYAQFTTPLMGFVDDVEFLLDDTAKVIHVRSASRLGKSDLGVNRKRVEIIRAELS